MFPQNKGRGERTCEVRVDGWHSSRSQRKAPASCVERVGHFESPVQTCRQVVVAKPATEAPTPATFRRPAQPATRPKERTDLHSIMREHPRGRPWLFTPLVLPYAGGVPHELDDKLALVTGGSGAIGRAICLALARSGARVSFSYFSDHEGAESTRTALAALGHETTPLRVNFGDRASTAEFLSELQQRFERLDILVHAAASGVFRSPLELSPRHVDWVLDVNAKALLWLVQRLLGNSDDTPAKRLMLPGASIVALSSLGAERAIPDYTALGSAKAALVGLVRQLALPLGPLGVRINVVSPGLVETGALDHFPNRAALVHEAERRTPLGRLALPDDVADVILFLCSPAAAMVHGQVLHVDGGYSVVG